ncbi:MAG TPA: hypothetical protein VIY47_05335, partial [Ignavibacteriaceae bacterium]
TPLLKSYYGTGGDLNIDEIHEVIPITESFNVWHPQEGVLTGHFSPIEIEKINKISQLRQGVSKVIEDPDFTPSVDRKYVVADMITGYGVAEAVRHFYDIFGYNIEGKRVIIQGWGNVGAAAAFYFAQNKCKIVGIIDRNGGIIREDGLTFEEVRQLFLSKNKNALSDNELLSFEEVNKRIWDIRAEVFIPAASSRLVTKDQVDRMAKNGLEVISCGANVPFADTEIFYGPISEHADKKVTVIPDFIANCGMARVFAYLMESKIDMSDNAIFKDTSEVIRKAIAKVHAESKPKTGFTEAAFAIALKQLI